jgi:hypothetical protein
VKVAGEIADDGQALVPPVRVRARRAGRPSKGVLGRDPSSTLLFQVAGEVGKQPLRVAQGEAEAAADPQVVADRVAQIAHAAPPGQGLASSPSA